VCRHRTRPVIPTPFSTEIRTALTLANVIPLIPLTLPKALTLIRAHLTFCIAVEFFKVVVVVVRGYLIDEAAVHVSEVVVTFLRADEVSGREAVEAVV
jgi:hypothetical protein